MDISINGARILFIIPIFGGITVTETQVNSVLVLILVFALCKFLTHDMRVRDISKRQIIAEYIVTKVQSLVEANMGGKFMNFTPFIITILAASVFSSFISLIGLYPPTADLNTLIGWSLAVFVLITAQKMKTGFFRYLRGFTQPYAVLTPFNIISEVSTPVSMAFRHFGNTTSGVVISTMLYAALAVLSNLLLGWLPGALGSIPLLQVGLPAVFSIYFDLFSGCLQAFLCAMLTMLYIATADPTAEQ